MTQRAKGTGSITHRADGRILLQIDAGWTSRGTRRFVRRLTPRGTTDKEAQRLMRRFLDEAIPEESALKASVTVKSYADQWLPRTARTLRPGAYGTTSSAIGKWIIPTIGRRRLDQLAPNDLRAVSNAILAAGLAPSTANRYRAVLAKLLKDARLDGHRMSSVLGDVESVPAGRAGRAEVPLGDAREILRVAKQRPDAARWMAALYEGMRPAEVLGLTWDRVDLERGILNISWQLQSLPYNLPRDPASGFRVPIGYEAIQLRAAYHLTRPKSVSGEREIPMPTELIEALRAWKLIAPANPHNLVFCDPDSRQPMNAKTDRKMWRALVTLALGDDAEIPDLYSCRHTCVSILSEARVPPEIIIAIVGHSTYLSTVPYIHVHESGMLDALDQVASQLQATPLTLEGSAA